MNKFARMLMTDGRNPYGSRGGYVVSDKRRDYNHDDDIRRERDYDDDMRRYRRDYDDDVRYAKTHTKDYGEPEMFSRRDIETWKSIMHNEDGTRGEHFRPEQVRMACQQTGIDYEEFGEHIFSLAMNMMYSDYCKVAKKYGIDHPEFYADLAKAFLRDKDFDGKPEEKLYLYYKTIVEKDD